MEIITLNRLFTISCLATLISACVGPESRQSSQQTNLFQPTITTKVEESLSLELDALTNGESIEINQQRLVLSKYYVSAKGEKCMILTNKKAQQRLCRSNQAWYQVPSLTKINK